MVEQDDDEKLRWYQKWFGLEDVVGATLGWIFNNVRNEGSGSHADWSKRWKTRKVRVGPKQIERTLKDLSDEEIQDLRTSQNATFDPFNTPVKKFLDSITNSRIDDLEQIRLRLIRENDSGRHNKKIEAIEKLLKKR